MVVKNKGGASFKEEIPAVAFSTENLSKMRPGKSPGRYKVIPDLIVHEQIFCVLLLSHSSRMPLNRE